MIKLKNLLEEDLRDWFGKGGKGGVGGGGWDRYNSSGDRIGKCGDAKEGDAYSACLSKEKARKLGKSGRAAFVKRKRAAQRKGGDAKKGGERSKGQKPIKVTTEEQQLNERMKILIRNVVSKMVHGAFGPITNAKMREEMKDAVKAAIEPILKKYDYVVETKQIKLKEIVQEIGDAGTKIYPYSKVKELYWKTEYAFTTDLKTEYIVKFDIDDNMADVSFFTKESTELARRGEISTVFLSSTNKGEMFSVMATITQIVKEFLDENETIERLVISPSKESDEDDRRFKLYMAYINKQLDSSKFDVEISKRGTYRDIEITRKNATSENLDPATFEDDSKSSPYGSGYSKIEEDILSKIKTYRIRFSQFNTEIKDRIKEWKDEYGNDTALINEMVARNLLYKIAQDLFGGVEEIDFANESKKPTNHFQMVMYLGDMILWTSPFIYVDNNHKVIARRTKIKVLNEDYEDLAFLKEDRMNLFLEKNIPTDPGKWSYYKGQAKKKFDVYPSAYANAWAAKKYKAAGGGWRKSK